MSLTKTILTKEQRENLASFGKKNGVAQEVISQQLPSATQKDVQTQVKKEEKDIQQSNSQILNVKLQKNNPLSHKTFFSYKGEEGNGLDIDLVTYREKGTETRYLSVQFFGFDLTQDPPVPQQGCVLIDKESDFNELKSFFTQLNWED